MDKADFHGFDPAGAGDPEGSVFGLPFSQEESRVVLVPVPWEPTTSYGRGTAQGPAAIRAASIQLDLFDPELDRYGCGRPWQSGLHMLADDPQILEWNAEASAMAERIIAAGGARADDPQLGPDLARVNDLCRELDSWVERQVETLLGQDKIVGVVGGDHSVALGAIRAHAARYPGLGILHIDAHADLRQAYEGFERSHASVLRNVVDSIPDLGPLVQVGVRDLSEEEHQICVERTGIFTWFDFALRRALASGQTWARLWGEILAPLPEQVYVTFDIDGLDPSLCPSTGTPVPGGLSFCEATGLLMALLAEGKRVVGFDVVEVAPSGRAGDQWDGNVGARILYKLCGVALASRSRDP